jgi:hypothetical protein
MHIKFDMELKRRNYFVKAGKTILRQITKKKEVM